MMSDESRRSVRGLRTVRTIAGKELLDFIRDWRTLLAVVLVPLLMFPAIFVLLPLFMSSELEERQALELDVEIQTAVDAESISNLTDAMSEELFTYEIVALDAGLELNDSYLDNDRVREGSKDLILKLEFEENGSIWSFYILFDSTKERSSEARSRILGILFDWEDGLVEQRIDDAGLSPAEVLDPLRWGGGNSNGDVATKGEQAGFAFSLFIPMIVALWTASSAIQPAIDMTAGERERGTMEALLCSPASRFELLLGKWLAVTIIAAVSVGLQLLGLMFALSFLISADIFQIPEVSPAAILLFLLAVLVFAIMVVAIVIALAVRSRSVKEAGSILAPLLLMFIVPAIFAEFINLEGIETYWFAIPVVNVLLAMRELLQDDIELAHVLVWTISSLIYAAGATWYASRQFLREDLVESIA